MILVVGLALLGLTLYSSTLAYSLRAYSRSQVGTRLSNGSREPWLEWLDEREWELQTAAGLVRLSCNLGVFLSVWAWLGGEQGWGFTVRTGLEAGGITVVLLSLFAIAIPHALSIHAGDAVVARSLGLLYLLRVGFWPFGRLCDAVEFVVRRLLGKAEVTDEEESERAEQEILDAVSEGEAYGAVDEEQKEMIESVIELGETAASVIMTPRTDINAVPAEASFEEVRRAILERGHSRIPVYEKSVDHIIGVVYAKDLLRLEPGDTFEARQVMRKVPYVPETKTLDELLDEFRATKVQIAIVLDEYGGTAGLVTIEDILEELVGEIDDEYDQKPPPAMNRIDDDTLEVDARVHISEINEELEINLPDEEDYDTIGGFVFATLGKIPATGEEFRHDNVNVKVVAAEPRRINRVRLHVQSRAARSA